MATNSTALAKKSCVACRGDIPPITGQALQGLLEELGGGWTIVHEHHLQKSYPFQNFREALAFTNQVGEIAEQQGHHPDLQLAWGKVTLLIWTHKIDGLTESDFILAAKADEAYRAERR